MKAPKSEKNVSEKYKKSDINNFATVFPLGSLYE